MKKFASIILSAVLILNIFYTLGITVSAKTSGNYEYSTADNNATIIKYYGSATDLIIPSQLDGYTVTSIGNFAFLDCTSLNSVTIPDSVTSIGNSAFRYCENLTSITIGNSVTSIESLSFEDCKSLTSINVESNNNNYTSVNGNLYNKKKTELIQYAVGKTDETFLIPDSVTSIGNSAFSGCTSLMNVNIPDSVTSIGNSAFSGCTSLMSVSIPDSVTSIGSSAFYNTAYYSNKSNWKNDVLYIGRFLISANASIADVYRIKDGTTLVASSAFSSCENIRSITIPDSVTSIGDYAFYNCRYLSKITIPDSVTSIGERVFGQCKSLSNIEVDINNLNYSSIDGNLYNKETTKLIHCAFAKYDFYRLTFPNGVTSIGSYAFDGCSGLTDISIPDSVTSIDDCAFYRCASLKNITLPNSVTSIGYQTFFGCTNLESITIPDSVTSIGNYAFYNCTNLKSITIPDSITSIGDKAFSSCKSITTIKIPDSVKSIGDRAFYSCTSLKSITIPDSVTSIGDGAFYECTKLSVAVVPIDFRDLSIYNIFPRTTEIRYREKEITVNYDANGGNDAPEQLDLTSDSKTISFTVTEQIPSRTGYLFEGWSEEPNGSADYLPGKTYTISNSITLYAVWKERHTYTIKYELSGGEGDIPSQIKIEGIDLKLSSIIPTHPNYTFAYWISSDKQTTYSAGSSYKADANLTLYAVWKEKCSKCNGTQYTSTIRCTACNGFGTITTKFTCSDCNGTGKDTKTTVETCSNCDGRGFYWGYGLSANGMGWQFLTCPYCNGTGTTKITELINCKNCGGNGIVANPSPCLECHSTGKVKIKCDKCKGKGYFYHYPDYSIEDNPDSELTSMILGDVDGDSNIEVRDATWIQRHNANVEMPFVISKTTADVDGDGIITVMDATAIQYYLANMKTPYKIGEKIE